MNIEYKKYVDSHAVDHVHAGFDFQFFAFLYLLIGIEKDETIKYESDDDILLVKSDGTNVLIQVKHGIDKTIGSISMLTELDDNLWKTLKNWMELISLSKDPNYISTHQFVILTNKGVDSKNILLDLIRRYSSDEIQITKVVERLKDLKSKTASSDIIECIDKILALSTSDRKMFFRRLNIIQHKDITQNIKDRLKYKKSIHENKIEEVFANLIKEFKITHYHNSVKRKKTDLAAEEIYKKIRNTINPIFTRVLQIDRTVDYEIPTDLTEQVFTKQLLDVGYLDKDDTAEIKDIYIKKIGCTNRLCQEQIDCNINSTQLDTINKNAMNIWSNKHKKSTHAIRRKLKNGNSVSESELQDAGASCLYDILDINLEPMDLEMTNGYFYDLSDKPHLGWRYDWETKYKAKI